MKGKFIRNYRSKNGTPTFVYEVEGSKAELEAYQEAQGVHYREDEDTGKPLFFTTRFAGNRIDLIVTASGNVIPDTSEMDKANSLAEQFDGKLGDAIAAEAARKLMSGGGGGQRKAPVEEAEHEPADEDLGDM